MKDNNKENKKAKEKKNQIVFIGRTQVKLELKACHLL